MTFVRRFLGPRPSIFFTCLLVWTLTNMDQALFGYIIPGIITDFHVGLGVIGIVLAISFATAAVLVIFAGIAADRLGRGRVLCGLLLASAAMVALQSVAQTIVTLTVFRALGFALSAGLSPITNALVVENATPRYRGLAMGLLQCGYPLGWFLASFGAAPLLAAYDWRAVCLFALLVVPFIPLIFWMLRRAGVDRSTVALPEASTLGTNTSTFATLWSPAYRRVTITTAAVFFAFGGAYAGSAFFFPAFFNAARGYSPADAAALVGLSNGIGVFGYIGAAFVGEFVLTRRTVFVLWCLGGAAAFAGLLWLSADRTADLLWYGVTAALFFGSQAVVTVFVAEMFPARIRAGALAICASAPLSLGFAVFPLIVPKVVAAEGWRAGLSIVVVPLLIAAGLIALLLPNRASGVAID